MGDAYCNPVVEGKVDKVASEIVAVFDKIGTGLEKAEAFLIGAYDKLTLYFDDDRPRYGRGKGRGPGDGRGGGQGPGLGGGPQDGSGPNPNCSKKKKSVYDD